ncbi:hypothetical protein AB0I28_12595 [Phytomonospora sp. NPDC050363]|uniref:hypothetical protein n=1 Tax=Phytomonospora sp. NPDC050363 TaxID=3155642 RepID=UPI0033D691E3
MRVRVTETCSTYFNYGVHVLKEGDVIEGGLAEYLAAGGGPVECLDAPEVPETPEGLPDGSADDVLAWVGEDPDRALEALLAEEAKDKPRVTLLGKLRKLMGDE